MRWLILLHRYLGIAIGWLLVVWCLSGVVMMYVGFPELTATERARALPALSLAECCETGALDADLPVESAHVEMLSATEPVLRTVSVFGGRRTLRLTDGSPVDTVGADDALALGAALAAARHTSTAPRHAGTLERDQWTVTAQYDPHRPLHLIAAGDEAGTQWYVSGTTGELVLETTRAERLWNWVGAVPHWLYPTLLRQNGPLWIRTVIWTSVVGVFLTVLGLFIGVARLKRRRSGRLSPYRGIALWHHWLGLVFGLLALTWVGSGLLSVNPWGLLESSGAGYEARLLQGSDLAPSDVARWLDALGRHPVPEGATRLELSAFDGAPHVLAHFEDGKVARLDLATLEPAPLAAAALEAAAAKLGAEHGIAQADWLTTGDDFYFEHHAERPFPVYRVVLGDDQATRYYIDATTGRLLQKVDGARRAYRWLFEGLHRFDFTAALRQRPAWDLLMIVLLAGTTGVCATGTYMGLRFLLR